MPGQYAAVAQDTDTSFGDANLYELETVERQKSRPISEMFMPVRYHQALNASANGTAGDTDSDSEDGPASEETSLESLLERKSQTRSRDGQSVEDVESQPAWARKGGAAAEHNVLKRRLVLPTLLVLLVIVLAAFFAGSQKLVTTKNIYTGAKKRLTLQSVFDGTFGIEQKRIDWLAEAGDGVYSYKTQDGSIMLHDLSANTTRRLVKGSDVLNHEGIHLDYQTFSVSSDMRYILFGGNRDGVWRHSSRSNFYVHDLESGRTLPLHTPTFPSKTAIAQWAPKGHSIAYVFENDLYVTSPTSNFSDPIRVTNNGNETIFNGIPDWVYEEEVFSSDSATWWSPDGKRLAFLSFDESEVRVYSFPVYNPDRMKPGASAYPTSYDMRYPKPGTPNPKVKLYAFDLEAYEAGQKAAATYELVTATPLDVHDKVITQVAWVGDDDLIIKETNRAGSHERVAHFDFAKSVSEASKSGKATGIVTRDVDFEKLDGGWVETGQYVHGIDAFSKERAGVLKSTGDIPPGYLDVLPDKDGYMHVAFFSPPDAADPVFLTSGEWEVDDGIRAVDLKRRLIYFIAANPSTQRHLYSIPIPTTSELQKIRSGNAAPTPEVLTDTTKTGFYDVSFSPQAGFYLLNQRAGLPWQKIEKVDDAAFQVQLTDNARLNVTLAEWNMPKTIYQIVEARGVSLNVAVTIPPNLDTSGRTKYPVLLRPYGGPNSQQVQQRHRVDWSQYLASELGYIILEVDGRGTGMRGRKFRSVIRKNLGEAEAQDQIHVAEIYAQLPYVDEQRIGIQGWSYGGYLAAKVVETNASVIALGMSVAPVTDWRYYDSVYTERYMGTLEENRAGYEKSAVTKMDGFRHADYLFMHGSGDDNVHYLNSAALLDRLTWEGVRNFRFRMFTDSAHSMGVRAAYPAVFRTMTDYLVEKLGKAERRKHSSED